MLCFDTPAHPPDSALDTSAFDEQTARVIRLSAALCRVAGVTVPNADFEAVLQGHDLAAAHARSLGLTVHELRPGPEAPYPFLILSRRPLDTLDDAAALIGHIDVVPHSEAGQFQPRLDGVDLYARGSADMKTVVATWIEWLATRPADTPVIVLLSSCEENGSAAPHHSESALRWLESEHGVHVRFALVGERTGELEWMRPEPLIGPICKENRSWRWTRAESADTGMAQLEAMATAVRDGRMEVHRLNLEQTPADKTARQPGVRSGLVNSFALAATDPLAPDGTWICVRRASGAAIHSAAATVAEPSLLEHLWAVARAASAALGEVWLGGLVVGEDGNFNSYDGTGELRLVTTSPEAAAWVGAQASDGLTDGLEVGLMAPAPLDGPTLLGIDIRELLDHSDAVDRLILDLEHTLPGFRLTFPSARPAWRCPADHPDLLALEAAYEAVVGAPSPDLVKLHGNDGGSLAALEAERAPERKGIASAVVFGQVGMRPHGRGEFHRCTSIAPYWRVLDLWADALAPGTGA